MTTLLIMCYAFFLMLVLISQAWSEPSNHLLHHVRNEHQHHHHHGHHHKNAQCSRCPPGWGVVQRCSPEADTRCEVCPTGTYSPHHSAVASCWGCARCGPGLYEAHPCTSRADTLCDRCSTISGPHNPDFSRHCNTTEEREDEEEATEVSAPPSSARRAALTYLSAEAQTANTSETQEHPPLSNRKPTLDQGSSSHKSSVVALSAAVIAILQTALLVIAGGVMYLLVRRLRSATCLRDQDTDKEHQEFAGQEMTLLQDLSSRDTEEV